MKKRILTNLMVSVWWCLLGGAGLAQTAGESTSDQAETNASITFLFATNSSGSSLRQGRNGDSKYYVRVTRENNPSLQIDAPVEVNVQREDNGKEVLVYSFAFEKGSSPRVEIEGNRLTIRFLSTQRDNESVSANLVIGSQNISAGNGEARVPSVQSLPLSSIGNSSAPSGVFRSHATASGPSLLPANPSSNSQNSSLISDQTAFSTNKPLATANVDLAVPESPAFTVLGLTPETVVRPTSPRKFASALLNGVDQNGNFQSGIAMDLVPYLVLAGKQLRLRDYQSSYLIRLLARTQLSFGTTKGASSDDKSMRLALGLHATLWDHGDPHNDKNLIACFTDALKFPDQLPPVPVDDPGAQASDLQKQEYQRFLTDQRTYDLANAVVGEANNARVEKCRETARKDNWNKSSWIVAAAPSWISPTGQTKDMTWNGGGFWSSLAYGFEGVPGLDRWSQVIVHARYRTNESVADPNAQGQFLNKNTFFFGSKMRVGNENSTASFEGVFMRSKEKGQAHDTSSRFSFGLERKVAENMWFNLSFGSDRGRDDGANKGFVLTSFKWGFSEKKNPLAAQ